MPGNDRKLTREELDELTGEELPDRVAMSLVANLAGPVGAAVGADALADHAAAGADAEQQSGDVEQSG